MSLFSEIEKIDDSNDNEWQPAIVLPASHMCDFHREMLAEMPQDIKDTRDTYVGKRIWIRLSRTRNYILEDDGTKRWLPRGECCVIQFKTQKEGKTSGCFSCEVSTD
jgi:hypothetical protein